MRLSQAVEERLEEHEDKYNQKLTTAETGFERTRLRADRSTRKVTTTTAHRKLKEAFRRLKVPPDPEFQTLSPFALSRLRVELLKPPAKGGRPAMLELSRMIHIAIAAGSIRINPLSSIRWTIPAPEKQRVITNEEWTKLEAECAKLSDSLVLRASLAYYVGLRHTEALALRFKDVDLKEEILWGVTRKHRDIGIKVEYRPIPIPAPLVKTLQRVLATANPEAPKEALVFANLPQRKGQRPGEMARDKWTWQEARITAGLREVRFHDLRHTFATNMHAAGAGTHDLMAALGHKAAISVARYVHPKVERLRKFIK